MHMESGARALYIKGKFQKPEQEGVGQQTTPGKVWYRLGLGDQRDGADP